MPAAKTSLAFRSLCCRTPFLFPGLQLQLEATNSGWPNSAATSGWLARPGGAPNMGCQGLTLGRLAWPSHRNLQGQQTWPVTEPHAGPCFSAGRAQTLLPLGDPMYLAKRGRLQVYTGSLGPPADRRLSPGTQNGSASLFESPTGNACFSHSHSPCCRHWVEVGWGEAGARVQRKAQLTACVSMFVVG